MLSTLRIGQSCIRLVGPKSWSATQMLIGPEMSMIVGQGLRFHLEVSRLLGAVRSSRNCIVEHGGGMLRSGCRDMRSDMG